MKKAMISGITGQDGAYLAKLLLDKDTKSTGHFVEPLKMHTEGLNFQVWVDN
jgi:GDP-D-mannose dehydratase